MSVEENKAISRRTVEDVLNRGDFTVFDESVASNYVFHGVIMELNGPEAFKQYLSAVRNAFPDAYVTIDDIVAEGDNVALRFTFTGTHEGNLSDIAPTGKQVTQIEAIFYRFAGGKVVEAWQYANLLAFYQQLGISPLPAPG